MKVWWLQSPRGSFSAFISRHLWQEELEGNQHPVLSFPAFPAAMVDESVSHVTHFWVVRPWRVLLAERASTGGLLQANSRSWKRIRPWSPEQQLAED